MYKFPEVAVNANPSIADSQPFGALAQSITDRNGNQILLGGAVPVVFGGPPGAGSYSDTAGRSVVSWSGFGNTTGDTLTFPDGGNISIAWTTANIKLPLTIRNSFGSSTCSTSVSAAAQQVISRISLPNQTSYSF